MKKSESELRESILDKIMTAFSNGGTIRPGIRKKLDKDPELKKGYKQIEKDLQKLGKKMDKINKDIENKYKGTPLEKFFSI
jgi:peptidoglycan hydrolase CwlO-like protein|tara:strand:+ start:147 stop:389 length:243 start_codon:yes stop_codon:yes gene_type:complete